MTSIITGKHKEDERESRGRDRLQFLQRVQNTGRGEIFETLCFMFTLFVDVAHTHFYTNSKGNRGALSTSNAFALNTLLEMSE